MSDPFLPLNVKNAICQQLLDNREVEACGMITLSSGKYEYVPCDNVHEEPASKFKFSVADRNRIMTDPTVVAYAHTHPNGPACPSKRDMEIQGHVGKPSVICSFDPRHGALDVFSFGDHVLDYELMDRTFRHGVTDCYEAIRAWFWQNRQVRLDSFPRNDAWWFESDQNEDMYTRNFESQGFQTFTPDFSRKDSEWHPRIGDCVLIQFGAPVVNHAAVYVGNNKVFHHRTERKSGVTPIGYLMQMNYIRAWVRLP